MLKKVFILSVALIFNLTVWAQGASHDPTFITGTGFSFGARIESVQQDAAGNIYVGGAFGSYNGQTVNYFAKLNPNGSLNTAFQSVQPDGVVWATIEQPNGQIIIAGGFHNVSGVPANRIARINANGSVDAAFCANIGTGADQSVRCLAIDASGNIYAGGYFDTFNGQPYRKVVKLLSNGSIDTSFPALNIDDVVFDMKLNSAGNLWIGGAFTTINSTAAPCISRLTPTGAIDPSLSLTSGSTIGRVNAIALQSSGSLVVAGAFSQLCGTSQNNIVRLNANGSIDGSFLSGTGPNDAVSCIVTYADDRIFIGGNFTDYNSQAINRMARLLSNGSLDISFDPLQGPYGRVSDAIIQPDKKIVAVGNFDSYMGNYAGSILRTLGELSILSQSSNTSICQNTALNLNVTASNCSGETLIYQWYLNGNAISGATSAVYAVASAQPVHAGNYTCLVNSTSCGSIMSAPIVVTVNLATVITAQPTGTSLCVGSPVSFNVTATGSNITYQWYKNATAIAGANASVYSIASITSSDGGSYRCNVLGSCGNINSNYATLYLKTNTATTNTTSITLCQGGTLTMNVSAGGLNPTLQWKLNGNPIPGATFVNYTKTNATSADAGVYNCQATSACGVVTTANVIVTVNQLPVVTTQPLSNNSVCQNGHTFSIAATGGSLTYKWYKNGVLIAGATSSSYSPPTGMVSNGNYYCVIANACGPVTSNTVTYNASDIAITVQPVGGEYCNTGDGAVSVAATGSGVMTYQWYNGATVISGANAPTYNFSNVTQNTDFKCLVSNGCFSTMSSVATITISTPITFIPKVTATTYTNYIAAITNTTSIVPRVNSVVSLEGGSNLIGGAFSYANGFAKKYIVALNGTGAIDNNFSVGGGSNGIIYDMAKQADGKIVVVGSFYGINGSYQDKVYRFNANGTFDASFAANYGSGPNTGLISVAVQDDGKVLVGGNFSSISGVSRKGIARLNPDGSVDQTFGYNGSGTIGGYVNDIAVQRDDKIIVAGGFQTVNGVSKKYVVRLNPDGSIDNTFNASGVGANNSVFALAVQNDGKIVIGGWFNQYNTLSRTGIIRLNTDGTPETTFNTGAGGYLPYGLTLQPDGKILASGAFTSYNGTTRKYIVRINTDGTVDSSFNPPAGGANNDGYSTCLNPDNSIVFGGEFTTYGGDQHLRIVKLYNEMNVYPQNPVVCNGSTIKLYIPDHDQNIAKVVWRRNGNIVGTQTNSFSTPAIAASSGTYTAWLENACGGVLLGTSIVTVVTQGAITSQPANITTCAGTNTSLSVGTTGYIASCQWFKGAIPIAGQTGATLVLNNVQIADAGNYSCKVTAACGVYYSSFGSVTVNTCGGTQTGRMAAKQINEEESPLVFEMNVYPNPAKGFITVDCKEQGRYKTKIFTLQGKELLAEEFDTNTQMNLSNLSAGMYLLHVYDADDRHLKCTRIIVE